MIDLIYPHPMMFSLIRGESPLPPLPSPSAPPRSADDDPAAENVSTHKKMEK